MRFIAALLAVMCGPIVCAETSVKAYEIASRYSDAVVAITMVTQMEASGGGKTMPDRDFNAEGVGTVIDSQGWVVSALSMFDLSSMLNGQTISNPKNPSETIKIETRVKAYKDVKMLLPGGEEVKAELVLKDPALDLAIFRADAQEWKSKGGAQLPAVDLSNAGEARLLEEIVALGRGGIMLGRNPLAMMSGIAVKMDKPRLTYRASAGQKGGPAFLLDGKVLGIQTQNVYQGRLTPDPMIIPAADIAELLRQAKAAAPAKP